ncbi:MAG: hypothetical protein AAGD22_04580 [Verrucomicrobiota bacterium]
MPQISNFGLAYFRHLTLYPVFEEYLAFLLPRHQGAMLLSGRSLLGITRFFELNLPEAVFTLFSQAVLSATLFSMLSRRWRQSESHLLGKRWATALFALIQVSLLGSALPLIHNGLILPSREFTRRFGSMNLRAEWTPDPREVIAMSGAVWLVPLAILWTFTTIITPNQFTQLKCWRRARKHSRSSLGITSDPATALPWVATMAVCGSVGWFFFTRAIVKSRWFPGSNIAPFALAAFSLVFLTGGIGFQSRLESKGGRIAGLATILLGLVPLLLATVLSTIDETIATPAIWIAAISPVSAPSYATITSINVDDLPLLFTRAIPNAFWFSQILAASVTAYLVIYLRQSRRRIRSKS